MRTLFVLLIIVFPFFLKSQTVQFTLGDTVFVEPGAFFDISFHIQPFSNAVAFQGDFTWDTTCLTYIDTLPGILNDILPNTNQSGNFSFIWASTTGVSLPDSSVLLKVRFQAGLQYPKTTQIVFGTPVFYQIFGNDIVPQTVIAPSLAVVIRHCTVSLDLGPDQKICPNQSVTLLPNCMNCAGFQWSDSIGLFQRKLSKPDTYEAVATAPLQCISRDSVRVETLPLPIFTLPPTANICPNEATVLAPQPAQNTYTYQWSNGQTTRNVVISEPGIYTLKVTNPENCPLMDTIRVEENGPVAMAIRSVQPDCQKPTGTVVLGQVQGGMGGYLYSIDNGQNFKDDTTFINLPPGLYQAIVQDVNGCEHRDSVRLQMAFPPSISIHTPVKTILNTGDSLALKAEIPVNYPLNLIQSVIWQPKEQLSHQDDSLAVWIKPERHTTYIVTLTSKDGCTSSDSVAIQVRQIGDLKVFVPTIFAPDRTGNNQVFLIVARDARIERIRRIGVYDRWGNLVFETNNAATGWDGTFKGRPAASGVYGYVVQIDLKDDSIQTIRGDVTIIR